jgi:hypothetical protein
VTRFNDRVALPGATQMSVAYYAGTSATAVSPRLAVREASSSGSCCWENGTWPPRIRLVLRCLVEPCFLWFLDVVGEEEVMSALWSGRLYSYVQMVV